MGDVRSVPLPYVDTHTTVVPAGADAVWQSVGDVVGRSFAGRPGAAYARLVGVADRTASGPRPLTVGAAVRGFRVTSADPERELVLTGRHRFSAYTLTFRLEPDSPGRTRVSAETRAVFPGPAGRLYRLLVIDSGAHAALMRRMLAAIGRGAV
ncbi:SRPBCC family protein [Streptomyces sp. NPDC001980]|uniref:SRPBCC family protein n=1 Tax=Streptomyces sp. NPDC001980 TaxID=3157126 RepID=UPI0033295540